MIPAQELPGALPAGSTSPDRREGRKTVAFSRLLARDLPSPVKPGWLVPAGQPDSLPSRLAFIRTERGFYSTGCL